MNQHFPFENPPLPYPPSALEPYIDTKTMSLHHDLYLQTYVDNLNQALTNYPEYHNLSLEQLLICVDSLPQQLQDPVRHYAGGVYNHTFFFRNMSPDSSVQPTNPTAAYIFTAYGNYENFKKAFSKAALSIFGSGYAWLVLDAFNRLKIITTANQDTPLTQKLFPLLTLDVWEHAYFIKHYNHRTDYIDDWFHIINWEQVNQTLSQCFLSTFF